MSTETTPAAPKASASVFHEEIVLIAEKLGELHDRFERIESEHVEQRVPLDAAKSAQDAALAALTAALQGMKALNFHVLDNNLGAVSKRVEAVEKTTAEKDAELAAGIQKVATALTQVEQVFRRDLSAIAEQKTELGRKVESDKQEAAQHALKLIHSIAAIREELDAKIEQAKTQFSTPAALNPRGDWSPSVTYNRLDVVTLNGTSYVSRATTREKPRPDSPDWQILARRGGMSAQAGGGVSDVTGLVGMGATGLQIAQAGTPEEVRVIVGVDDFEGATSVLDGEAGRVPQPLAGDQNKYLRADGTWATPSSVTAPAASQATTNAGTVDDEYVPPRTLHGYVNPLIAARADFLESDGATTNRAVVQPGTAKTNLAGVSRASLFVQDFLVPTSNPASSIRINDVGPTATTPSADVNRFSGVITNTGSAVFGFIGATLSDTRLFTYAGFRAAYSGQRVALLVELTQGTATNPVVWILVGGAGGTWTDISSSFTLSTGGTPPDWLDASLSNAFHLSAFNWPSGIAPRGGWILGHTTAADRAFYAANGRWPGWVRAGGDVRALYSTDFSTSTGWTLPAAMTISGGTLNFDASGDGTVHRSLTLPASVRVVLRFTSSAAGIIGILGSGNAIWTTLGNAQQAIVAGLNEFVLTTVATTTIGIRGIASGGAWAIDDLSLTQLGSLTLTDLTPDQFVRDTSEVSPKCHGYIVGHRPRVSQSRGRIIARRTTDGFLWADTRLVGPGRGIVGISATGNGTISIGDTAAAPATVLSGATATANVQPFTPLKASTTDGKIYLDLGTATDATVFLDTEDVGSLS
jgi:hypothetical protein